MSAQQAPLEWISTYSTTAPVLDGAVDDSWEAAKPLTVTVREAVGADKPRQVTLYALHTDDSLYVLAQWADTTRSDRRDPYLWNAEENRYERPTTPDDQFALEFPLSENFQLNMLADGVTYSADVWHWKAGRSNLGGWVDDKRHLISPEPMDGAAPYQLGGHATVYIARPMDAGDVSYQTVPAPEGFSGEVVSSYTPATPNGSQADIRGKAIHDGAGWTLEMSRLFDTGFSDDAVLDPREDILCAIAILDDELYWRHSVSQMLVLRFR